MDLMFISTVSKCHLRSVMNVGAQFIARLGVAKVSSRNKLRSHTEHYLAKNTRKFRCRCLQAGVCLKRIGEFVAPTLLLCAFSVQAETFNTQILAVLDGDTVLVKRGTGTLSIRLAEIDAPEKAQPFGETSKKSLSDLVMGKSVNVVSQTMDQYGRMVAHLSVGGLEVNAEQIRRGMAWEYSHFHSNKVLIALQKEAQSVPRGLWALSKPIPPWEWRKTHPYQEPASAPAATTPLGMSCGSKKYCNQMTSCDEAKFYLTQCGVKRLDGNGDGVPCETLCTPAAR